MIGKTREEALKRVLEIYRDGSGECGVYRRTRIRYRRAGRRSIETQSLSSPLHRQT
jgi:ATP-dependent Clp protease adapter protein ClpS